MRERCTAIVLKRAEMQRSEAVRGRAAQVIILTHDRIRDPHRPDIDRDTATSARICTIRLICGNGAIEDLEAISIWIDILVEYPAAVSLRGVTADGDVRKCGNKSIDEATAIIRRNVPTDRAILYMHLFFIK